MSIILPAVFFGHGNPMNALQDNVYTRGWRAVGEKLPPPRAILAISAHWYVRGSGVTISMAPETLHDFGGFPPELFAVRYPAKGDMALALRVQELLSPVPVSLDRSWGLDHGTWSVLKHVYPNADVPVVQLSIDGTQPPQFHFDVGRRLAQLREEGVLIVGSGNLVHNLRTYAWGSEDAPPYEWAARFEAEAKGLITAGDVAPLINYQEMGQDARLSVPTPEHYLPLLYVLGTQRQNEAITFPVTGMEGGSISMLAAQVG